eukprot:c20373_g1_i6.p1 GENE.c20373_g1_i6~~c20373_g1_i6.p1  ORF type:complete len:778 (+),score=212.01 c20373_g1_i6:216-2336(+)
MAQTNQFFEVLGFCSDAFAYHGQRVAVTSDKLKQTSSLHESSLMLILQTDPDDTNIGLTPRGSISTTTRPTSGLAALESRYSGSGAATATKRKRGVNQRSATLHSIRNSRPLMNRPGSFTGTLTEEPPSVVDTNLSEPRILHFISYCEAGLSTEVDLILLEAIRIWLESKAHVTANQVVPAQLLEVLLKFGRPNQSNKVTLHWIHTVRYLLERYTGCILGSPDQHVFVQALCTIVYSLMTAHSGEIRAHAISLLYVMFRCNHRLPPFKIENVRAQSLRALAGFVETLKSESAFIANKKRVIVQLTRLNKSLAGVEEYRGIEEADNKTQIAEDFFADLKETLNDQQTIVQHTITLEKGVGVSFEKRVECYHDIADAFAHTPELKMKTLMQLCAEHSANKNFAEEGMCVVVVIRLIINHMTTEDFASFSNIASNFDCLFVEPWAASIIPRPLADSIAQHMEGGVFTLALLKQRLKQAYMAFFKADLHETCILVLKQLLIIGEMHRVYAELSIVHQQMAKAYEAIEASEQARNRFLANYYRVRYFCPDAIPSLHAKEFIYKEPGLTRLGQVTDRVKEVYGAIVGADKVHILTDSTDQVENGPFEPGHFYAQITYLEPYVAESEVQDRVTVYERNTRISEFVFETPFTTTGAKYGSLREQQKRIIVMTVKGSFPTTRTRLTVVSRTISELSPIQNARASLAAQVRAPDRN